MAYFSLRMHETPYFHFRSKIWRHHCVPQPRFSIICGNFGDLRIFNAVIGLLLIFACILKTSSPEMRVFPSFWGETGERVVQCLPQWTRFYFRRFLRLCQFWWKSIKKCERDSAGRWTHGQRQTGFIICPALYAIATRHIKICKECKCQKLFHRTLTFFSPVQQHQCYNQSRIMGVTDTAFDPTSNIGSQVTPEPVALQSLLTIIQNSSTGLTVSLKG